MTREEAERLQAGPELDYQVAGLMEPGLLAGYRCYDNCPCYSIDIAAAWPLFKRLSKEFGCDIGWHSPMGKSGWYVTYGGEYDFVVVAGADTAPLAICRAVIRLFGKGDER